MSHNPYGPPPPGSGYPPPPGHGYPPPPPHAPGAFAYVPAPVMMPLPMYSPYPQQPHQPHPPLPHHPPNPNPSDPAPTYVTNYYYSQLEVGPGAGQGPVQIANAPAPIIDWVPTTPTAAPALSHRAFIGGKDGWDGNPLWIIRAHHSGEFVPGKLAVKHRSAYVPHDGKEVPVHNIEVLCAPAHALQWVSASNGDIPVGGLPAGNTHNAEPLYIGRVRHLRSITPGKVHPSHGCCYISFGGSEIAYKNYEVLCKVVG